MLSRHLLALAAVLALLLEPTTALTPTTAHARHQHGAASDTTSRRQALSLFPAAAALAALARPPMPAIANTEAELASPTAAFGDSEVKRAEFTKLQAKYKKAWRKELSNLEFATSDAEAVDAVSNIIKLIRQNGNEIPQGIRKQDLDQVYKRVKPSLGKEARLAFLDLDALVGKIVSVKSLKDMDEM